MRQRSRLSVIVAAIALLAGCMVSDPSASQQVSQESPMSSEASAPASGVPASSEPVPTPEPIATDDLEAFSCNLPVVEDGSVAVANIVDVRVGTHDGYDRVVFEFDQGTPELTLDRAEPPFTQEASGLPMDVDGQSFMGLVMRGGSKQTDAGTSSYAGSTDISPDFPALVHLIEGGDFERQSTWYLGLTDESCVRVLLLDAPPRLVIDVEH